MFELVRMTPNLLATLTLVTHRRATFRVTPKGRMGNARRPVHEPVLLRSLAVVGVAGAAWYAATIMGATPLTYEIPWAAHAAFAWLCFNIVLLVLAIRRVRSLRYAAERRASFRFTTGFDGRLGGQPVRITDVSLTGARLEATEPLSGMDHQALVIAFDGREVAVDVVVRTRRASGDTVACGVEFLPGQHAARARLALALFHARIETPLPAALELPAGAPGAPGAPGAAEAAA